MGGQGSPSGGDATRSSHWNEVASLVPGSIASLPTGSTPGPGRFCLPGLLPSWRGGGSEAACWGGVGPAGM